jgi:hypothetical protein
VFAINRRLAKPVAVRTQGRTDVMVVGVRLQSLIRRQGGALAALAKHTSGIVCDQHSSVGLIGVLGLKQLPVPG